MTHVSSASWRAIGTGIRLVVHDGDLDAARGAVEAVLDAIDRTCSRFRDDSEIVAINARAGERVPISPLLADALAAGIRAARLTDGAVDPTVGRAMRAIGYDVDFDLVRGAGGPIELRLEPVPGWQTVDLSVTRPEVRVPRGVELDLGSTGKALAADLAAAAALETMGGRGGVLVSFGGDIAVGGSAPDGGWRILVAEDSETPTDGEGERIAIRTGAIATSSITVRRWQRGDIALHHLIDPRTGGPVVSPWRTASVVAATCVDANAAATAAIVMAESAVPWLEQTGLAARLVGTDGAVTRLGGWPDPLTGRDRVGMGAAVSGGAAPTRVTGSKGDGRDDALIAIGNRTSASNGAPSS
ncbi:MAG TPA: FAD:protein FMN transferase [Candidatus Limnocylindrales bacterium]|nr:FAD:protein FMN transferase [Candidatus Limnocylindrales bacterium]